MDHQFLFGDSKKSEHEYLQDARMLRAFKIISHFLWRSYVWFCVFIISIYLTGMTVSTVFRQFDRAYLPNETYLSRRTFFSTIEGIVLRDMEGKILVNEDIEFVCFNDRFIQGYPYHSQRGDFIYEKGQPEAIYSKDPRYFELWKRSGLASRNRGCGGHLNIMTDFENLLRYPQYRKPPPSRK